jgi:hypothetical protein
MLNGRNNFELGNGDRLESRARREASRRSPGFSEPLHARIMQAVQTSDTPSPEDARIVPRPAEPLRKGPAIAAAFVAVCALVVLNHMHFDAPRFQQAANKPSAPVMSQPSAPMAPSLALETVPAQVQTAVATAVDEQKFGGLDRDAQRMTHYIVDQVPFLEEWNHPRAAGRHAGKKNTSGEFRD